MSAKICNLLVKLDEVHEDLACHEHDVEMDPNDEKAAAKVNDMQCRITDIVTELKGLGYSAETWKAV